MNPILLFFMHHSTLLYTYNLKTKEKKVYEGPCEFPQMASWTMLPDGSVLYCGGIFELYKPLTTTWIVTDEM
jgi:hypothetical protein